MGENNLNITYDDICYLNNSLVCFDNEMNSADVEYEETRESLEASFGESKVYWIDYVKTHVDDLNYDSNSTLRKIEEMYDGLNSLDIQLCKYDPSYAKRREMLTNIVSSQITLNTEEECLSEMREVVYEAKNIASECCSTSRSETVQEISMLFSNKRIKMYERFIELIFRGEDIRDKARTIILGDLNLKKNSYIENAKKKVEEAANETNELISLLNQRYDEKRNNLINSYQNQISQYFSSDVVEHLIILSNFYRNNSQESRYLLPNEFRNNIDIGECCIYLDGIISNPYVIAYINQHFEGLIYNGTICIPYNIDLSEGFNLMLFNNDVSYNSKIVINSIMYSLISSQPASNQKFILFDPEGRSQSFSPYLEFIQNYPKIMYEKVFTTKEQIQIQVNNLSNFIDDFTQSKLAYNSDIFEYNKISSEKPEPLKCLCLLNFPRDFDESMIEQLYNIVKNGAKCGIQTLIDFDENSISYHYSDRYSDLLYKIRENCLCLENEQDYWRNENIILKFKDMVDRVTLGKFFDLYAEKYKEFTNSSLPIEKLISKENMATKTTESIFSVPIGKDEEGNVLNLEFGDPISKGTSHHALVAGSLGSGKSTLLHTIIMSTLMTYSPDEINLYLLDFKSGTEFQVYANYKLPHVKVIALDAMQEFGYSVLEKLEKILKDRLEAFTEESRKGYPVKDITSYREYTGKKMPRILVVADEFQILFSLEHNSRVAMDSARIFADIISLYRVCGIHFVLATQTLSRLRNECSVSNSTFNEMYVRIGLKCSENECGLLFGSDNLTSAFSKMGDSKGTAVYDVNYVMEKPVGFKVAYCDPEIQKSILSSIESKYLSDSTYEKTKVFSADTTPKLKNCYGFNNFDINETFESVPIYMGEPIRIDNPVTINVNRRRRNTLLILGTNQKLTDNLIATYISGAVKSKPHRLLGAVNKSVYLFDGLYMMGENYSEKVGYVVDENTAEIEFVDDVYDVTNAIDKLYDIFNERRKKRAKFGRKAKYETIHIVVNNFQWIEPIVLMLNNKRVDEYILDTEAEEDSGDDLFAYLQGGNKSKSQDDILAELDSFNNSLISDTKSYKNISYHDKMVTLINSGYTVGINVVMSCNDFLTIKEIIYEIVPKFQNKIIFGLNDADADRVIMGAKVEKLKQNMALYYDGINPAYQFKPYEI